MKIFDTISLVGVTRNDKDIDVVLEDYFLPENPADLTDRHLAILDKPDAVSDEYIKPESQFFIGTFSKAVTGTGGEEKTVYKAFTKETAEATYRRYVGYFGQTVVNKYLGSFAKVVITPSTDGDSLFNDLLVKLNPDMGYEGPNVAESAIYDEVKKTENKVEIVTLGGTNFNMIFGTYLDFLPDMRGDNGPSANLMADGYGVISLS